MVNEGQKDRKEMRKMRKEKPKIEMDGTGQEANKL